MGEVLFVTGTDTGVGKTVASAWLAARAAATGLRVVYVKPVQTGVPDDATAGDAAFVTRAAGVEATELVRFPAPLAPAEAAAQVGATIDPGDLVERTRALAGEADLVIVEGAGGLLVPLTEDVTMADLAGMLGGDVVVVSRPGLGTLNHTALTLEAAACRRLRVTTLIVSGWPAAPGVTERSNLRRLHAHGIPIVVIPAIDGLSVDALEPAIGALSFWGMPSS